MSACEHVFWESSELKNNNKKSYLITQIVKNVFENIKVKQSKQKTQPENISYGLVLNKLSTLLEKPPVTGIYWPLNQDYVILYIGIKSDTSNI